MKKQLLLFIFALITLPAFSQVGSVLKFDLKNGSVITGMIVEEKPGEYYKVKTRDNNVIIIEKETIVLMSIPGNDADDFDETENPSGMRRDSGSFSSRHQPIARNVIAPEIGPTFSNNIIGPLINSNDPRIGGYAGIAYTHYFLDFIGIKVNLGFERKGYAFDQQVVDTAGNVVGEQTHLVDMDYIVLSPLVKFALGKKVKFVGEVGPYLAAKTSGGGNRFDAGIILTPGIEIYFTKMINLSIAMRNSIGAATVPGRNVSSGIIVGVGFRLP